MRNQGLGEVDMFGLDDFGNPAGLEPLWGALIGPAAQAAGAVGVRQFTKDWDKWADGIGALASAVVGGVMAFFPETRGAGYATIASGLAAGIPRQIEQLLSETAKKTTEAAVGIKALMTKKGLGGYALEQMRGRGFGLTTLEPQRQLAGVPGVAQGLGQLASNPGAAQVTALGGPAISGLGAKYGATMFGGN